MSKLIFLSNPSSIYEGTLSKVNDNVIRLVFLENIPDEKELLSGLNIVNEHNGKVMSSRIGYETIYRTYEDNPLMIELSNNCSVWVKPLPKVNFYTNGGGTLEGETVQEVYNYEDLIIPIPTANENYQFVKWNTEIPTNGEIDSNKSFTAIFEYVPTEEELKARFEENKLNKISESKVLLANYLERHPLVSNCHNNTEATYTVTSEKQALMANNYLTYTIAKESGVESPLLTWNAAGCECEVWTEEEYITLVLQIAEYVKPLVSLQQSYEVQINACETQEELDSISIVYDVYGASVE